MRENSFVSNFMAAMSVAIVAVTLGAAFGVLADRGAFIGMISASFIALIAAFLGGSKFGASSPTGPMTAAIAGVILVSESFVSSGMSGITVTNVVNVTLVVAGVFLLLFAFLRLSRFLKYVPNIVVSGFVNGVALLIIISQFRKVGVDKFEFLVAFIAFAFSFVLLFLGKKSHSPFVKIITSSFTVIFIMSLVLSVIGPDLNMISLDSLSFEGGFLNYLKLQWPSSFSFDLILFVIPLAFEIALIAFLDTALTAVLVDKMSRTKTNFLKEVSSQGVSMFTVAFLGGIPGAQSTVPSVMLYTEGARKSYAKHLVALFAFLLTFVFLPFIKFVPSAVFAGVIINVGFQVADFRSIYTLLKKLNLKNILRSIFLFLVVISTVLISLNFAVLFFSAFYFFWNKFNPWSKLKLVDLGVGEDSEGLSDEV